MKLVLSLCLLLCCTALTAQDAKQEITDILMRQQNCWNQGDLNCFMNGYWESDSLMFIGKDQIYQGYQNTLQRYIDAYPDGEAMGTLTFTFKSFQPLGENAYFVVGAYHLARTIGDLSGHFTLLWRNIEGEWVIVADHSS